MRDIPPLNGLRAFEAAGRHLNFRLAADELGVTQGAVAQQVRGLETLLKVKLFDRGPKGLALTDAGRRYLPSLTRAFDLIAEAGAELAPRDAVVTISTTPSFATRWLVPRLADFARDHPTLRLRIDASNTLSNFQSDGVDIAVRLGRAPFGPGLRADPLFDADLIAVCHPDLARGPQAISGPDDLAGHMLLEDAHGHWPLFLEAALGALPDWPLRRMNFNQTALAIDAALARQGVALASPALVAADLAAGRLCQPFAFTRASGAQGYFIVTPRAPRQPVLVATVRDWMLARGGAEAPPAAGGAA